MALNRPAMARVSGTDEKPVGFKVIGNPCQLRPSPNLDFFSIGLLRKGGDFKGFPFIIAGTSWIKLSDEDAAIAVPDPARREDGVWVPQVHPKYGRLVQSKEEDVRYGAKAGNGNVASKDETSSGPVEGGVGFGKKVTLKPLTSYEEMLQAEWTIEEVDLSKDLPLAHRYTEAVLEMVIDMKSGQPPASGDDPLLTPEKNGSGQWAVRPAKGAIVKRVPVGNDMRATVSNMPDGRYFLISVVVTFDNTHQLRSRWVRVATLNVAGRDQSLGNIDPGGNVRGKCEGKNCGCSQYVPLGSWNLNSDPTVHCRRCGCPNDIHAISGRATDVVSQSIKAQEGHDSGEDSVGLPRESKDWDEREKNLWLWSNGALHPRQNPHAARKRLARDAIANKGRVSVVCPTMEERQHFHEQVWSCFVNQDWPDKELIIVETFQTRSSDMFRAIEASGDKRLVYLRFRCGQTTELSIGCKRNIATHIASGDYIASFDDDDIYAPTYLSRMISAMYDKHAAFVTLSSWYFFDIKSGRFGFFDAKEYARVKKMRDKDIDGWLWGYGFSYLHKLQPALDKKINYPDQNMEEDIKYIRAWKQSFGDGCAALLFDDTGIVCHTLHGRNTSNSFALREVTREEMRDTDVAELPGTLDFYMGMFPRQEERSRFIEYEADSGQIQRRMVERKVHWLNGIFTVECTRGAHGYELKELCAWRLRIPIESIRIHRQAPEGGFLDLGRRSEEAEEQPEAIQQQEEMAQDPDQNQSPPEEPKSMFAHILGTWVYGSKATEYVLSDSGAGELMFTGPHSRVGTVQGVCTGGIGIWLQFDLTSPDGERIGQIRLKYIWEAEKMISNYRSIHREEWGKDIHAQRKDQAGTQDGNTASPASPSSAAGGPEVTDQPQTPAKASDNDNAEVRDSERIGAYVLELWLVITNKDGLARVLDWETSQEEEAVKDNAQEVKTYAWTQLGVDAVRGQAQSFGYPREGDPFTEEHRVMVETIYGNPAVLPVLESGGYIKLVTQEPRPERPQPRPPAQTPSTPAEPPPAPAPAPPPAPDLEPEAWSLPVPVPAPALEPEPLAVSPPAPEPEPAAAPAPAPAPDSEPPEPPPAPASEAEPVPASEAEPALAAPSPEPSPAPIAEQSAGGDEELRLVVHIDQALNLREVVTLRRGSTIGELKEQLAKRDVTGMFKASDFRLAWEANPHNELLDTYRLSGTRTVLILL